MQMWDQYNAMYLKLLKPGFKLIFVFIFVEGIHYSFSKSKYFHLRSADTRIYLLLDNELDRKIDVTALQFLSVQNRHQTHG